MENVMEWNALTVMNDESRAATLDPDALLMLRFREGDLDAFEHLFSRHSRPLVNFAFRFVRNRSVAEDLAQEIFLKVHDAASSYRPEAKFTTWLYRIATNVCLNEVRRPYFRARHESLDAGASDDLNSRPLEIEDGGRCPADDLVQRQAISRALEKALAQLPEKQRVAFVLNKYQDLSYAEVADVMKTSEKAVKSLIHRAKEAMAAHLKPQLPGLI